MTERVVSALDLYNWPANVFTAGFIGSPAINLLPGHLVDVRAERLVVALSGGQRFAIDAPPKGPKRGLALDAIEELGHSTFAYGLLGDDQEFRIKLDGHHDLNCLDRLKVYVNHK